MTSLDFVEAVVAGAGWICSWVELGVVVEGDEGAGVPVAEYVTAFAAVVSSNKGVECAPADWVITDRRLGIRLRTQTRVSNGGLSFGAGG